MTTLTITPKIADKTARFKGAVAAGEHVAVTIKGGAAWLGDDNGEHLSLRVLDLVTGRTLAVFPRPEETYGEDEEYVPDEWDVSAENPDDLFCNLNLNTDRMVNAARHMLRVPVLFVMGAKDEDNPATTRTLYFRDRYEVEFWPERVGDDTPYDLDKWPKQIDEWTELVTDWNRRMNAMKLSARRVPRTESSVGKVTITLNDGNAETDTVVDVFDGADGEVTTAQLNTAIARVNAGIVNVSEGLDAHAGNGDIHVTATQKTAWTAKYDKPSGGIPTSDLSAGVQASLERADTAVQDISEKADKSNTYTKDETNMLVSGAVSGVFVVAQSLPATGEANKIYLVPKSGGETGDVRDEYVWVNGAWELIGSTRVDLSNYYDKTAADGRFVQKEAGKGLVAVDAAMSTTSGNPVQNRAVAAALSQKLDMGSVYPEWLESPPYPYQGGAIVSHNGRIWQLGEEYAGTGSEPGVSEEWADVLLQFILDLKQDALTPAQLANIEAVPNKADAADLRYRIATLTIGDGQWSFAGDVEEGVEYGVVESNASGVWEYTLTAGMDNVDDYTSSERLDSVLFMQSRITATRPYAYGTSLLDRASNRVTPADATALTLTLPAAVPGYMRDLIVRLDLTALETAPEVTFAAPSGETVSWDSAGDPSGSFAAGTYLYRFTEVAQGMFHAEDMLALVGLEAALAAINGGNA